MECVLSHDQKILFLNAEKSFGITTNAFGNFSTNGNGENREKFLLLAKELDAEKFIRLIPKHDTNIVLERSRIAESRQCDADAAILNQKGGKINAFVHCSWITLSLGIVEKTMDLVKSLKSSPNGLKALIYGGICQKCYEVDDVVFEKFSKNYRQFFFKNYQGKYQMDLAGIIWGKLIESGISGNNIKIVDICSHHFTWSDICRNENEHSCFSSYRNQGDMDRNMIFWKVPEQSLLLAGTTGNCPYAVIF